MKTVSYATRDRAEAMGRKVIVEVVANAYKEEQHRVIQCNIRDVTERILLQEQMRGQALELSDLHRRKDEFLAMLSHELRNPLASIANAVRFFASPASSYVTGQVLYVCGGRSLSSASV